MPPQLEVYFDEDAPAVDDWTRIHQPALERARAFLLVCSPGAMIDFGERDWVQAELRWWLAHRSSAPLVIDSTGAGDRYIPAVVKLKWQNAQRTVVVPDQWAVLEPDVRAREEQTVLNRLLGGIQASEVVVRYADLETARERAKILEVQRDALDAQRQTLERQGRRLQKQRTALAMLVLAALGSALSAGYSSWSARTEATRARQALATTDFREAQSRLDAGRFNEALAFYAAALRLNPAHAGLRQAALGLLAQSNWPLISFDDVVKAAFSPNGTRLVTASTSQVTRVWDARTGRPIGPSIQHPGTLSSVVFSDDGYRIVTTSKDAMTREWAVESGQLLGDPVAARPFEVRAVDPLRGRVVKIKVVPDRIAVIWDTRAERQVGAPLNHELTIDHVAFSADGTKIVTASRDRTARVWDASTGRPIGAPLQHTDWVVSATFSPDGTRVVTASNDKTARIWNTETGQPVGAALQHHGGVWTAEFSSDGTRVVTASIDQTAQIWSASTGQPIGVPLEHRSNVQKAVFSADGARVLTVSQDGYARVWAVGAQRPVGTPFQHADGVNAANFSLNDESLVTASHDQTARVWSVRTGMAVTPPLLHDGSVMSAEFSNDGRTVVTGSADETARLWDAKTGEPVSPPLAHRNGVYAASFSPDQTRVVTASFAEATIWNIRTNPPEALHLQQPDATGATFNSDGTRVLAMSTTVGASLWDAHTGLNLAGPDFGGLAGPIVFDAGSARVLCLQSDGHLKMWDAQTGKPVDDGRQFIVGRYLQLAQWSADRRLVVTDFGETKSAQVWDAQTAQPIGQPLRHQDSIYDAAFSPDGSRVATASGDRTARVWDVRTGLPVSAPLRHRDAVYHVGFSRDGNRLVSASRDGTAEIWDVPTGAESDALLLSQAAEAVAGYTVNEAAGVVPLGDAVRRLASIRQAVSQAPVGQPTIPSILRWIFSEPWNGTISPLSEMTVKRYVSERLSLCTPAGIRDVEEYFLGHPLLQSQAKACALSAMRQE